MSRNLSRVHLSALAAREHRTQLEKEQKTVAFQLLKLGRVGLAGLGVLLINWIWDDFFVYPYFSWEVKSSDLAGFWPLFVYGLGLILLGRILGKRLHSSYLDERLLGWGIFSSWLAAIWEELGYRFVFVCYAMIGALVLNWLLGTVAAWFITGVLVVVTLGVLVSDDHPIWIAPITLSLAVLTTFMAVESEPVFWFYQSIFMPVLDWVSFGSYSDIIDPDKHDPWFVIGAIVANAWFRDGHKYQGSFGLLSAWTFGFITIYATMQYGLLVAVLLHGLWNSMIDLTQYLARKFG